MGPAAALQSCSGPRPACLSGSQGPSPTVLRVLSLGSPMGPSPGFSSRQWRRQLTGQPGTDPGRPSGWWSRGLLRVCMCVISVHIYAKGAAQAVQLPEAEARPPEPLSVQGAGCGAAGQGQGLGLACSASTYLLNTSSCWAVTFPSRPRLLEQKSLGPPHSPASGQS